MITALAAQGLMLQYRLPSDLSKAHHAMHIEVEGGHEGSSEGKVSKEGVWNVQ